MVEAIKWILLGLGIGVAVEYARHIASLKELLRLPDFHVQNQELVEKSKSLETLVPSLKADIETHLKTIAQLEADLKSKPQITEVASITEPETINTSLEEVTSLPPQFRAILVQYGITTPALLAEKTETEIQEVIQVQPWDMVNPGEWITEAKSLSSSANGATPIISTKDDLSALPNITKQQLTALTQSPFATFAAISQASESQLLEVVEAMPWDIVNPKEWISYAKAHA